MDQDAMLERRQDSPTTTSRPAIPLNTIYTPPPSCNDIVTYDGTTLWQNGVSQLGDPACYPPSFSDIYNSFYSPGICPQSWKSVGAVSAPTGVSDAMCCPSGYFLSTTSNVARLNNFCFSLMTAPLTNVYTVASLTNGSLPSSPQLVTLSTNQVSSTTVYADVIQIQWQSTNTGVISLMEQATASGSSSAATPGSTSTSIPAATPSTGAKPTPSSTSTSGLSTGSKIGIGIGVPVAVIAIAALAALIFISRRRRRRSEPSHELPGQDGEEAKPIELHPESFEQSTPVEMDARPVVELPGDEMSSELDGRSPTGKSKIGGYFSLRKKPPRGTPDETSSPNKRASAPATDM